MTNMPHVLVLDGQNLLYRARSGFSLGAHAVTFNLFRSLRALVDEFHPTRVAFILEGHCVFRKAIDEQYKANRIVTDEKEKEKLALFYRQCDEVIDLLSKHFPVSVMRHPEYECDDTIFNLIKRSSKVIQFTVVSSDTDFIQLLNSFENVKLYNPISKKFIENIPNYVLVKSLTGDGTDNIEGIDGIGPVTANAIVSQAEESRKNRPLTIEVLRHINEVYGEEAKERVKKNIQLITFAEYDEDSNMKVTSTSPERNWDAVANRFKEFEFKSILKESYWAKFTSTFDQLWNA